MDGILNGYTSSVDLLKMVTEAYENDMAVFEAAISADYVELFTESVILSEEAEEESKEAAKDKQKENKKITLEGMKQTVIKVLTMFKEKLSSILDSILDKIDGVFGNVAKKVEAKKDTFMKADCSHLGSIETFAPADNIFSDKLTSEFTDEKIKEMMSIEKLNLDEYIAKMIDTESAKVTFDIQKNKKDIIDVLTDRAYRDSFVKEKKDAKKWADNQIAKIKSDKKDDKENSEFYNFKIKVINAIQRTVCKSLNKSISVWRKQYFDVYRVFCKAIKVKDDKAADQETTANASYMFELEEAAFIEALESI